MRLQLGQLAALERDEILKEYNELREQIRGYETLLADERTSSRSSAPTWSEMRDKYGDDRKTEITDDGGGRRHRRPDRGRANVVTISHDGYIKRLPLTDLPRPAPRRQGRRRAATARGRLRRALLRRLDARLPALLHQPRPVLLAEGLRHPAGEPHQRRPGDRQRAVAQAGGEDHEHHPGPRVRRRTATC